jgi:hypothetical protein
MKRRNIRTADEAVLNKVNKKIQKIPLLKGLSYEIYFENVDEN